MTNYVKVQVPEDLLADIYRFLADAMDDDGGPDPLTSSSSEAWPTADLARFAGTRSRGLDTIHALMDMLAADPGVEKTTTEVASALSVSKGHLKGAAAGLSRHLNSKYGGASWPLSYRWTGTEIAYFMTPEMAAKWIEVRDTTP